MDDAAAMGELQPLGDVQRDVKYKFRVQRLPRPDARRQAAPLVIGHHKKRAGGAVGNLQHGHDVGMFELLQMARLLDEAMEDPLVRDPFRPDQLDGHAGARWPVARQQHHAHAAAAQNALDFKLVQGAEQSRPRRRGEHLLGNQFRHRPAEGRNGRRERRGLGSGGVVGSWAGPPWPAGGGIFAAAWRSNCLVPGHRARLFAGPKQAAAQVGVREPGDAGVQPDQGGGDAGVVEGGGDLVGQAAFRMIHVGLGKILGQFQQFQGRGGMVKEVGKAFQEQALGLAQFLQPRGGGGIVAAQVHQDGGGHLMAKNGPQFLRPPKSGLLPAGLHQGGEALRLSVGRQIPRSQTRT